MTLVVNDYGKECEMVNGKDEYEFYFSLEEKGTLQILKYLRNKHGYRSNLQSILEKEFGYDDGPERFCGLCEQQAIRYLFFCYLRIIVCILTGKISSCLFRFFYVILKCRFLYCTLWYLWYIRKQEKRSICKKYFHS